MDPVEVRTGEHIPLFIVTASFEALQALLQKDPLAFIELVRHCRDHNHVISEQYEQRIKAVSGVFYQGGGNRVHDFTKHVIVSAVEGDGMTMRIVSPFKPANDDETPPTTPS